MSDHSDHEQNENVEHEQDDELDNDIPPPPPAPVELSGNGTDDGADDEHQQLPPPSTTTATTADDETEQSSVKEAEAHPMPPPPNAVSAASDASNGDTDPSSVAPDSSSSTGASSSSSSSAADVAPSPSPPAPLSLDAHSCSSSPTPSSSASAPPSSSASASSTTSSSSSSAYLAQLEQSKGINSEKLSPADFSFGTVLGEGSFARVVIATRKNTEPVQQYAAKIVDKHFITKMGKAHTVINEKKILTLLHGHVGIIKLHYTFQDSASLYYVMELAKGGEMFSDIKKYGKYDLSTVRVYAAELIEIIHEMHSKHIVHRDLKPENLLFSEDMHLKLTDFGTAKELNPADASSSVKRRGSFVGTAEYVSPEVLKDDQHTQENGTAATSHPPVTGTEMDLWALGVIIYQMATGKVPFKGNTEYLTFQKILKGEIHFPEDMDADLRDLILKLLVLDPSGRLGAGPNGFDALRSHPFFSSVAFDWSTVFQTPVPPRPQPTKIEQEVEDGVAPYEPASEQDIDSDLETEQCADKLAHIQTDGTASPSSNAASSSSSMSPSSASAATTPSSRQSTTSVGQASTPTAWSQFLRPNERIIFHGIVVKRRALLARKRALILTDTPRLFYVDPDSKTFKKEIPWSDALWAEAADAQTFYVHVPGRDYYMRPQSTSSYCWVNEINNVQLARKTKRHSASTPASAPTTSSD